MLQWLSVHQQATSCSVPLPGAVRGAEENKASKMKLSSSLLSNGEGPIGGKREAPCVLDSIR